MKDGLGWKAGILQCAGCGWYTGWKATRNRRRKSIDTTCQVCSKRMRYTIYPDASRSGWGQSARGRGAQTRMKSVLRAWATASSTVKRTASDLNKGRQKLIAARDGVEIYEEE